MFITDSKMIDAHILDSTESMFFVRELEHIKAKSYDTKYQNLKATDLIPVSTDADAAADKITYRRFTKVGTAKIIADYADDFPRVDIYGEEVSRDVYSWGASYGYSQQEIRRSQKEGKGLDQKRANATKRASDQAINDVALNGDADYNIPSFLAYPGASTYNIPDGAANDSEWSTKTPDEILADLNGIVTSVIDSTNGVEAPNTILVPINQYRLISTTRVTDTNDTILSFFLRTNGIVTEVDWLKELESAGAGDTDRIVAYVKDPDHLTLEIPMPYTQYPPQQQNLYFKVLTEHRCAGVIVYYPQSLCYGDDI